MFAFVSAFPKTLHCTDEAQQTETVLSAVLSIYIYIEVEKIPEGQEHAPRLEPAAPIRLADRNHAHYPSRHCTILKKDSSMTDFERTHSNPHGSHWKMFSRTLGTPNPWCMVHVHLPFGDFSLNIFSLPSFILCNIFIH